jgi:serine/threonine protein kinase
MAEILKARDTSQPAQPIVAVKRILPHLTDDKQYVTMFLDESRVLAQLEHDNIIRTLEVGQVEETPFIALEYVWGQDARMLFHRARKGEHSIPIGVACYIIAEACAALHHAHEQADGQGNLLGLVHRDVSLQNILVSYDGAVKLTDFGIAMSTENVARTEAGIVKGKFGYMSPEQIKGETMDRRSDVFAAGICLYELLTCERLFSGESDYAAIDKVRRVAVEPPSRFNREVDSTLEAIAMKALSKYPRDRFQSAGDMRRALLSVMAQGHHECSASQLGDYMRSMFADELSKRPTPEALREDIPKRSDEPTGLAAFDNLDPISTMSGPSAVHQSPLAGMIEPYPRSEGVPSVPPVIPRRDSVPAPRGDSDVFVRGEAPSSIRMAGSAAALDRAAGSGNGQVALDWEDDQLATGTEPFDAVRALPDPVEDESADDDVTRQLYIGETFTGVAVDASTLRSAGVLQVEPTPAGLPSWGGPEPTRRTDTWLTHSVPQTSYATVVGIVIAIVAVIAGALYLTRGARAGEVRLATAPADADVMVDGKRLVVRGSPFIVSDLAPGTSHRIEVSKSGYRAWSTQLVLTSGQVLELPLVTLEPVPAVVAETPPEQAPQPPAAAVESPPPQPERKLQPVETAPPAAAARTESTRPALKRPRPPSAPVARKVPTVVAPGAGASSGASAGMLRINSRPWAELTIDGRPAGNTPQMNLQLPAGSHTVKLTNPQFGLTKTIKIQIQPGQTVTKVVSLQ